MPRVPTVMCCLGSFKLALEMIFPLFIRDHARKTEVDESYFGTLYCPDSSNPILNLMVVMVEENKQCRRGDCLLSI